MSGMAIFFFMEITNTMLSGSFNSLNGNGFLLVINMHTITCVSLANTLKNYDVTAILFMHVLTDLIVNT
jgi:hypothetical protein